MHTNLFSNKIMDDITARSLVWLVHQEHVKKLMTDLFLMIYKNRDVEVIIQNFLRDVISDYLKSNHCLRAFCHIVAVNTLQNKDTVLPGLYQVLTHFLKTEELHLSTQLG